MKALITLNTLSTKSYLCINMTWCLFFAISISAQIKHDYVWIFGHPAGNPPVERFGINFMDFNGDEERIYKDNEIENDFWLSNTSMSDEDGNLLFYSNGCYIVDVSHEIMENGDGLNPGNIHESMCPTGGYSTTRGLLSIPLPNHNGKYSIFHEAETLSQTPPFVFANLLYYSVIDIELNGGLGSVVEKNQIILEDHFQGGNLHAVKHSNNDDWWVIHTRNGDNKFFKILFTENGIEFIMEQNIGMPFDSASPSSGQAVFSPDGSKLATFNKIDQVYLYDFERSTGELSNFQHYMPTDSIIGLGGVAFSPNNRFLYVSAQFNIYQYDLWAPDIEASKVEVGTYDYFFEDDIIPTTFYLMQLAPDCRIYIIVPNTSRYMHIIHNPNEKGLACNFEQRAIKLPGKNPISQPNFPNYRLGTGYPVCDSSIVLTASPVIFEAAEVVKLYPNPVQNDLYLELFEPFRKSGELVLFNQMGQAVSKFEIIIGQTDMNFSVVNLESGIYFFRLTEEGIFRKAGMVIIQK